ncbi:hypothetical protein LGMT14_00525 [Lactococcus garvieae]|nr:hypothetical protein LGMT14_00525 [Lactococcus garvieae]
MNKKQNSISQSWLCVILILLCLFGVVSLMSTLETNKVKREQIRLYNRINNLEQSLKTKELLVVGDYDHVEDLWLDCNKNYTPKKSMAHKFTQEEIDSMETGSYELVPVEDGE